MTLECAFKEFILSKKLQNLSSETIKDYDNMISIFLRFVGPQTRLGSLTKDMVNDYILSVLDKGLSKATVASYIRNMRIFLTWISRDMSEDEETLSFDPKKIKVPKTPKKNVHIYSATEIQYLLDSVCTSVPWLTARNRCILALMLDSGIRQCEVCTLLKSNVDFERMTLMVTGKGAKQRLVPLGYMSMQFIRHYYELCPYDDMDYVFLDRLGKPLTGNAVRLFVNRLKHSLPFDLTSHKLRHNFATNFCVDNLKISGNTHVYDLSILMGHESIETTKRYEHFAHELIAVENTISHLDKVYKV